MQRLKEMNIGYYQYHFATSKTAESDLQWLNDNCDKVFIDKEGERISRKLAMEYIGSHKGEYKDTLVLIRLNDFVNSLDDFIRVLGQLAKKTDSLICKEEDLANWVQAQKVVEIFRRKQRARTLAGARYKIVAPGRKKHNHSKEKQKRLKRVKQLFLNSDKSITDIAKAVKVQRGTIYRDLRDELGIEPNDYMIDTDEKKRIKKTDIDLNSL